MYPNARIVALAAASLLVLCACTHAANVVGIDFGSEWIKAAYIKSGEKTGVAIVLDPASARKFPNTMAFSNNERFFGLVAAGKGHLHYPHLRQLLGKAHNADFLAKCTIFPLHFEPHLLPTLPLTSWQVWSTLLPLRPQRRSRRQSRNRQLGQQQRDVLP
jgi:hypothetical protein